MRISTTTTTTTAAHSRLLLLLLLFFTACEVVDCGRVRRYNVQWDDVLPESASTFVNTMPVGNGDVALNVWPDVGLGAVSFLIAKGDAYSEAAELLKVGLVTVVISPNPFRNGGGGGGSFFNMTLDLETATVFMHIGGKGVEDSLLAQVYVDANANVVVVSTDAPYAHTVTATATLVRTAATTAQPPFDCYSYETSADSYGSPIAAEPQGPSFASAVFYHRNANNPNQSYVRNVLTGENFPEALPFVRDPIANTTFGGAVFGDAATFRRQSANAITALQPSTRFTLGVAVLTQQTDTVEQWEAAIGQLVKQQQGGGGAPGIPSRSAHEQWWAGFWDRSYIDIQPANNGFVVAQQYAIQRFIQATQARVPFPIKFNGMLFTANRPPNVDARDWGGSNWWQNLRLPYYNMLFTGDFDLLATLFQSFTKNLPLAQRRTEVYFNFSGVFWPEYTSIIGTTHPNSYGCGRAGKTDPPIWWSADRWNHYNNQGGLDLALLVLDHFAFTKDGAVLGAHLPMVEGIVEYYRQRWTARDRNGKVIMYPTQSIETWQCPDYPPNPSNCVTNDAPTIAGLWAVVPRLLALPDQYLTPDLRARWQAFVAALPPLPTSGQGNATKLEPCEVCPPSTSNSENAELYPVHPYRLITAGKPRLQEALNAYAKRRFTEDQGWNQNAMDAALLGLAGEAQRLVTARAQLGPAPGYRFQGFMPHLQDYEPSADHLAVMNNALNYMLLQPLDDADQSMGLLPAWPCSWDVDFRVNGPGQTVVEGSLRSGKLTGLVVTPPGRASAVRVHACQ